MARSGALAGTPALAPRSAPGQHVRVRPLSTAACFAAYLLPDVLFVAGFEERSRITRACCLAWNIALFPDPAERERHIQEIVDLFAVDAPGPAPPGFREGFAGELRTLAGIKRDLFPWRLDTVVRADLEHGPRTDVLAVEAGGGIERIELVVSPSAAGLPRVAGALAGMAGDTAAQRRTLEEARRTPGLVEAVAAPQMVTAYCAQRADLRGYRRMLAAWRGAPAGPGAGAAIRQLLETIEAIEADTKAVLAILAGALDAIARKPAPARH